MQVSGAWISSASFQRLDLVSEFPAPGSRQRVSGAWISSVGSRAPGSRDEILRPTGHGRLQEDSSRCLGEAQGGTRRGPRMPVPDALARPREFHGRLQEASPRWLGEIQGTLREAPGGKSPMAWRDTKGSRRGPRKPWHDVKFGSNGGRVSLSALPAWSWHASLVLLARPCERTPDDITKQRIWVGYVPG